jgi:hypothetical protein
MEQEAQQASSEIAIVQAFFQKFVSEITEDERIIFCSTVLVILSFIWIFKNKDKLFKRNTKTDEQKEINKLAGCSCEKCGKDGCACDEFDILSYVKKIRDFVQKKKILDEIKTPQDFACHFFRDNGLLKENVPFLDVLKEILKLNKSLKEEQSSIDMLRGLCFRFLQTSQVRGYEKVLFFDDVFKEDFYTWLDPQEEGKKQEIFKDNPIGYSVMQKLSEFCRESDTMLRAGIEKSLEAKLSGKYEVFEYSINIDDSLQFYLFTRDLRDLLYLKL